MMISVLPLLPLWFRFPFDPSVKQVSIGVAGAARWSHTVRASAFARIGSTGSNQLSSGGGIAPAGGLPLPARM